MYALLNIPNDVMVQGNLSAVTMSLPSASVGDAQVKSDAAIQVTKTTHLLYERTDGGIGAEETFAARKIMVYAAPAACTIRAFRAMLRTKNTTGTAGFDLKKNGSSILSSTITFTSADSDAQIKTGTLAATTLAAGDYLTVEFTVDAGTPDGTGPLAWVEIASPAA